jgi:hypothetical protein
MTEAAMTELLEPSAVRPCRATMPQLARPAFTRDDERDLQALQVRVAAEFHEMPCLTLTLAQASRLFSIDAARCERVLGALVERGVLTTNGRTFSRADASLRRT